jgi:RhoGEF domain/PH domain
MSPRSQVAAAAAGSAGGLPPAVSLPPPIAARPGVAGSPVPLPLPASLPPPLSVASSSSGAADAMSSDEREKQQRLRVAVLQELIETEKDYLVDMETLVSVFVFPMKAMGLVSPDDLQVIFSNVEDVLPIHQKFAETLEERFSEAQRGGEPHSVKIGDIFTRFTHYFKLYSIYTENQPDQLAKLGECQSTIKDFDRFLQVAHGDSRCRGLQLNAFLIKPVQRLCKYPLLLRELIKNTPEEHEDHTTLEAAREKVASVVEFVNEAKRVAEGQAKMREIELEVGIAGLATPHRFFHREGELMLYRGKSKSLQPRYLYLFNDLILLMRVKSVDDKTRKMHYEMRGRADLDRAKVVDISDDNDIGNLKHAFEITLEKNQFVLSAKSKAEKNQWLNDIKKNVKEFQKEKLRRMKNNSQSGGGAQSSADSSKRKKKGSHKHK